MRAWFTSNHDENFGTEQNMKIWRNGKPLAVFSATWDGVPFMYSGQELPLLNKRLEFFEKRPYTLEWFLQIRRILQKLYN